MAETKARFLANLIGATNTNNDFTLPNTAVSGTSGKVLTSGGDGTVTWEATELAPTTTSISPTEVESADDQTTGGNQTFTLTGENYATSGMTVELLATSGSNITSGITVTHGTATSLTITLARNLFVDANEPYSVKVTKSSGLTHTLSDAIRVDNVPVFTANPNTIVASIADNASNATHATIQATDAESDAITFAEVGTTLYDKFTSATPRGVQSDGTIKGVPVGVSADETTTFTVRATSTGDGGATTKNTEQNFRFTITNYVPQLFAGLTYTADGTSTSKVIDFSESNNFQPDMIWIKNKDHSAGHTLLDSVRGFSASTKLAPYDDDEQNTGANDSTYGYVSAVGTNSMTLSRGGGTNGANCQVYRETDVHVAYAFKAGGAPSGSLGDISSSGVGAGSITGSSDTGWSHVSNATNITQSVNQDGGFSITKFQGSANGCAFPHNLGGTPDFIIIKNMDEAQAWSVWHKDLSATSGYRIQLDTDGTQTNGQYYSTAPSSTTITCGSDDGNGGSTDNFICYAWKAVDGSSAFGTFNWSSAVNYTVSGLSFQPRFVMIKCRGTTSSWLIWDSFRGFGATAHYLKADLPGAELTGATDKGCTVTSNSFTVGKSLREDDHWIYMAFA